MGGSTPIIAYFTIVLRYVLLTIGKHSSLFWRRVNLNEKRFDVFVPVHVASVQDGGESLETQPWTRSSSWWHGLTPEVKLLFFVTDAQVKWNSTY